MMSNEVNGIINVLKPPGMTSHDVVQLLRRSLKIKKAGHTGTLDPGVAGVLPVCLGKATKIIEYFSDDIKQYRAEAEFGRVTDTQDGFGETVRVSDASGLAEETAEETLLSMKGRQFQVPPMFSALKHKGRKLYELARQGIEIKREPREIEVFEIEIIRCSGFGAPNPRVLFDIKCSRGTYVRTICHDLGEKLGFGAFMSFLVRTGTGNFHIQDALTLEEILSLTADNRIVEAVKPLDEALPFSPAWVCDDAVKAVLHGNRIYMPGIESMPENPGEGLMVKIMNKNAGCLAVARVSREHAAGDSARYMLQPVKVFCQEE